MTPWDALAAVLAALGAGGLGFTFGSQRERVVAQAAVAMWRELASELHAQNGRLRCLSNERAIDGCPEGETTNGAPNALHRLRIRLEVSVHEIARRLGIPVADVDTIEHTPFGLLDVDAVKRFVGALGCRLDVVAQHIDGTAHWLSDDHVDERPSRGES